MTGDDAGQRVNNARISGAGLFKVVGSSGNRYGRPRDEACCGETSFYLSFGDVNVAHERAALGTQ